VSMDTNQGRYYVPGAEAGPTQPTALTLIPTPPETQIPASGRYSTPVTLSAQLTSNGTSLAGKTVAFVLGPQSRLATTDANGIAKVTISVFGLPDEKEDSEVRASFAGAGIYQASYDTRQFKILKQGTQISLDPQPAEGFPQENTLVTATLTDVDNRRLGEETLFFIVSGAGGSYSEAVITDYAGRARLGNIPLPPGDYQLDVYFSGNISPLDLSLSDDRYEPARASSTLTLDNHVPQAGADAYIVDEDQTLTIPAPGVLGNDTDADGQGLTAQLVSGPSNGSLTLNPNGSFTYLPDANFNGSDNFTYDAYDGYDATNATVSITVTPVNDAPVAVEDAYSLKQNTPLVVTAPGVLGNDSDIDGDALQAVLVSGPFNGSLTLNPDGSFTYMPGTDFFGGDSFTYKANDGGLDSSPVTVMLYVTKPSLDSLWPPNGGFVTVSVLGATDPSGAPISITITGVRQDELVGSSPDAIINGSTVQLRAERDGNGDGRVYHIFFVISDGLGDSCTGEVLLGVVPHDQGSNLAPIDGGALYDSTVPQ
jgi:VCBS repeat-containing protein